MCTAYTYILKLILKLIANKYSLKNEKNIDNIELKIRSANVFLFFLHELQNLEYLFIKYLKR